MHAITVTRSDAASDVYNTDLVGYTNRLQAFIESRVGGRIRDLTVSGHDGAIVLCGHASSHHSKQLAQQAALEFGFDKWVLSNRIIVHNG